MKIKRRFSFLTAAIPFAGIHFFAGIVLASIAYIAEAAQLTASVDRDTIGLQETLTLTVTSDGQTQDSPDFSILKNDFDLINTSRSQSIRVINGHTEATTDWYIVLAPKHGGTLLIPSFTLGKAVSDAIEIHVNKQSQPTSAGTQPVEVMMEISKPSVFVQEQILVKIKLMTQVNLAQEELQPLTLANALVVPLERQQYQTTSNGKPQLILETNYAVFPQENGELVIPSLTYSVVTETMRDPWSDPFGRNRNNILRLRTDEQHITVKAAPDKNIARTWQPADKLTLNEGWSASLDHLKVGEPITRTITITADGLTGGQIAPLDIPAIDGLTYYPDQAQTKDNKTKKGIQGSRTETLAIIPNHGGTFTLPEIKMDWWDNATQTMRTATLPAKTLTVLGEAKPAATTPVEPSATSTNLANNAATPLIEKSVPLWLWLIVGTLSITVIALIAYVITLRKRLASIHEEHNETQRIAVEKENQLWDLLKQAATKKDAVALRSHLLQWGKLQWPQAAVHTLDDIARLADNAQLSEELKELDALLYSNHPNSDWQPLKLLDGLSECRTRKNKQGKSARLEPLYRNT